MRILQISTGDLGGGAERIAQNLHQAYRQQGHQSWLAVGRRVGDDPDVLMIRQAAQPAPWREFWLARQQRLQQQGWRGAWRLGQAAGTIAQPLTAIQHYLGIENFNFPGSWYLPTLPPKSPQVIHAHNLHGNYFDLRALPTLSRALPFFQTMHDPWLLTGHCGHFLDCPRWRSGCGECPDLDIYPPVRRDSTAYNWQRKQSIYQRSRLYVATPCQWLMDKVQASILLPGIVEARVIPTGIPLDLFRPGEQAAARAALGLPQAARILLFSGSRPRQNRFKDLATVEAAFRQLAQQMPETPLLLLLLGAEGAREAVGEHAAILPMAFRNDQAGVAQVYQAADLYLHAAHADTFPNVVLEALACATPVVATAVAGIPEQLRALSPGNADSATGILVPHADAPAMAAAVRQLLEDEALRQQLGRNALADAQQRFDHRQFVQRYLDWYAEALEERGLSHATSATTH